MFMKKPSVYGHILDRYLFNFRLDIDVLRNYLPSLKWLKPREINGYGVVSFCLLNFKGLTIWSLPTLLGVDTASCAYRCSVIDESGGESIPSVYLLGRKTDVSLLNYLGPLLLSANIEKINFSIAKNNSGDLEIATSFSDDRVMFSATLLSSNSTKKSQLFESEKSFEDFINEAKSSYTPSTNNTKYSRLDLETESYQYEQINAKINVNSLTEEWKDANLIFDSAYRSIGKKQYKLNNLGLVS